MSPTPKSLDRLEERVGEFLAAREGARRDFTEYAEDPVRFMLEVLKFEPWEAQAAVCRSVHRNKRTVVRGHHGAGKDRILAALLLWACYARKMLCIAISATERQLLGQLWAEVARLWTSAGVFAGELFVGELRIADAKRIVAMTSGSTSNLTGWHNERGGGTFVAISESQAEQVESAAFDAAEGNTAGAGSRICVVGNPVRARGRFYEVSRRSTWSAIRIDAHDHPNVREGRVVIPGGPAPEWPEEMALEYGTDSPFYVSRVLGEFPTDGSLDSLLRRDWIEAAFDRHDELGPLGRRRPPALSLDVARSLDRDENCAAIAQGPAVRELHAWRSRNLVDTAARFLELAARVRTDFYAAAVGRPVASRLEDPDEMEKWLDAQGARSLELWIDAPGVGGGVVDICRDRGRSIEEWWGWVPPPENSDDQKRVLNLRAAGYWGIRRLLQTGEGALPRDQLLLEELLAIEWSQDTKGRIVMQAKDDLRRTLGRSPDRMDACVISLSAANDVVARPTIECFTIGI